MKHCLLTPIARALVLVITAAGLGCGGASSATRPGVPPAAPDWVARGSRIVDGGFVGVGSVTGIANAPLARDTARNRARAEIARMVEVFTASLMKDYQASITAGAMEASDEGQAVEEAIKTYSAQLLNGTVQKDMWYDASSDSWFALVELDLERSQVAAAEAARMGSSLRAWVDENGERVLEGLERDTDRAGSSPAPRAALPSPRSSWAAEASPSPEAGARPGWVDGACDRTRWLCGVGDGATAGEADASARASLALIFEANVQTVVESFQGAAREVTARTGESWREVEEVSEHALVTSDKLVPMSEIQARWEAPDGRIWSLAVIDRARAVRSLSERIESLDVAIRSDLERARETSVELDRFPVLRRVLGTLAEREALNADLRVLRADGSGIPSPITVGEVLALLAGSQAELRFGLALAGPGAERVRDCLEAALTDAGHRLEVVRVDEDARRAPPLDGNLDVRVEGEIRADRRGRIRGAEVVQTVLTLRLVDGRTGRTLRTLTGSEKGTRRTARAAADTAAYKVCQDRVPAMVREIDRAFGR